MGGTVASAWALRGVSILFASAVYQLGARGIVTVRDGLGPWQWTALVLLTVTFVYGEGFRVLDRRWVPDMVERALRLRREGGVLLSLLAPLYGLSLIGAPRHRLLRAWAGNGRHRPGGSSGEELPGAVAGHYRLRRRRGLGVGPPGHPPTGPLRATLEGSQR